MSSYKVLVFHGRKLPANYLGLIFSKWLRSLRYGNDMYRLIDPQAYYMAYHLHCSKILAHPTTTVRIATLTDDPDVALGFSVSRGNVLDYVYVDKISRRLGIGKSLLPDGIESITHVTKTGLIIW